MAYFKVKSGIIDNNNKNVYKNPHRVWDHIFMTSNASSAKMYGANFKTPPPPSILLRPPHLVRVDVNGDIIYQTYLSKKYQNS